MKGSFHQRSDSAKSNPIAGSKQRTFTVHFAELAFPIRHLVVREHEDEPLPSLFRNPSKV